MAMYAGAEAVCDRCPSQVLTTKSVESYLWCTKLGRGMLLEEPECMKKLKEQEC